MKTIRVSETCVPNNDLLLCSMRLTGQWVRSSKLSNPQGYKTIHLFFSQLTMGMFFPSLYSQTVRVAGSIEAKQLSPSFSPCRPDLNQGIRGGNAGPFRCGKGSTWEGGFRAPGIAWWPYKIKHGRTHQVNSSCTVAISEWQLPVPTLTMACYQCS